jgi:pimeloyl-ACP methyl ester carboxylesterase
VEEEKIASVDRVSRVSKATLCFQAFSVGFAAISGFTHTHFHSLSIFALCLAMGLGALALLRVLNHAAPFLPRGGKLLHGFHAVMIEIPAVLAIFSFRLLRCFQSTSLPKGKRDGRPILLVHGYFNDGTVWTFLRGQLVKRDFGPLYSIHLKGPFRSIRDYVMQLEAKGREIKEATGRSDLVLIGYSMGGIVASCYATQKHLKGTKLDVITLAAPLKGTHMARLAIGANAREMRRNSPLLEELREAMKGASHVTFYHLGSRMDELVIPSDSSFSGLDLSKEVSFEDLGHAGLMISPRVAEQLATWLASLK